MYSTSYNNRVWGFIAIFCLGFTMIAHAQQSPWISANGPFGGSSVYAVHSSSDGTLYLGNYSNGVFKSSDQGDTWTQIHHIGASDVLVTSSGRIILGTDEIKWSDDGGDTWSYESTYYGVNSLAQHNDLLAAGGSDGRVHLSDDDGTSWISTTPVNDSYVWDLAILADKTVLAATGDGLFSASWPDTTWSATSITAAAKSIVVTDQEIFVATSFEGLRKSTDNGSSWQSVASYPLSDTEHLTLTADGDIYAAALDTMFHTTDRGASWEGIPMQGLPRPDFRALSSDQNGHLIAGIYESGAFRYDATNERWQLIGPPSTNVNDIFETGDGQLMVGTENSGLHIYDVAQQTWQQAPKPFRPHYANRLVFPNITFVGQGAGGDLYMGVSREIYTSTDNGSSWTRQDSGYTVDSFADLTATAWAHSQTHGMFIGTKSAGIYHSMDGTLWRSVNDSLPSFAIRDLEVGAGGEVYAGGAWNGLKTWDGNDSVWVEVSAGTEGLLETRINSIARHPDGALFAGNNVLRSQAAGWELLDIPSRFNYTVETIGITSGGSVFVATSREETFRSDDIGRTWTNVTEGLPDLEIRDFISSGDKIYAATVGLGMYQMENTSTSIADAPDHIPSQIELLKNYPNPFNPQTTIPYTIRESGPVRVTIYNVTGQKVTELVNQVQAAGSYQAVFDAKGFASGVYIYQLQTRNFTQSRKMLLIK